MAASDERLQEVFEDMAALEDALELSSLGPEKRTSILADIKRVMENPRTEAAGEETEAGEPWLRLPEFKARRADLPTFRQYTTSQWVHFWPELEVLSLYTISVAPQKVTCRFILKSMQ
jgi:hypothetical protein